MSIFSRDKDPTPSEPPRLLSQRGPARDLISRSEKAWQDGLNEREAWRRLGRRLARHEAQRSERRRPVLALSLAAALAVGALILRAALPINGRSHSSPGEGGNKDAVAMVSETAVSSEAARDGVGPAGAVRSVLPEGTTTLVDGTVIQVDAQSIAWAPPETDGSQVRLERGRLELRVARRAAGGRPFAVGAGRYRFQVLGTRFRVSADPSGVDLDVSEGIVAVSTGAKTLATVQAGGHWHGTAELGGAAPAPQGLAVPDRALGANQKRPKAPAALPVLPSSADLEPALPQRAEEAPDCLAHSREGRSREALRCFRDVAQGDGLSAQMALYEIARLDRDVFGDRAGAMAALSEYRNRFPHGALRGEVDLSRIELLIEDRQVGAALEGSEALLDTRFGRERAADLHLLRGNLYREALADCGRAMLEYDQISQSSSAAGTEALYGKARCLEALGRSAEAIEKYEEHAARPHAAHAADARARAKALRRP